MTPGLLALGFAIALMAAGALTAAASSNAMKKILGVLISLVGAAFALALLAAPDAAVLGALAIAFAYLVIGVAVTVRLQESYASIEAHELDAADAQEEPREPAT